MLFCRRLNAYIYAPRPLYYKYYRRVHCCTPHRGMNEKHISRRLNGRAGEPPNRPRAYFNIIITLHGTIILHGFNTATRAFRLVRGVIINFISFRLVFFFFRPRSVGCRRGFLAVSTRRKRYNNMIVRTPITSVRPGKTRNNNSQWY